MAIPFAFVYLAVFMYLIFGFAVLGLWKDVSEVPPNLIPAAEHPLFVGMVTNILFGLLLDLSGNRRIWPWADHVSAEYLYVQHRRELRHPIIEGRLCHCGAILSRYNPEGDSCGPCRYAERNPIPPAHPQPFWRCWENGCGRFRLLWRVSAQGRQGTPLPVQGTCVEGRQA